MTAKQQSLLGVIRRNLLNVFRQLSKVNDDHRKHNPINTLDIRPSLLSNQSSDITMADSPSLLFYYLFDDWYTSYALVAKSEHQYAMELEKLVRSHRSLMCWPVLTRGVARRHVHQASSSLNSEITPIREGARRLEAYVSELCAHRRTHIRQTKAFTFKHRRPIQHEWWP